MAVIRGKFGSGFAEVINGTSANDTIFPLGGWDTINGGGGIDTVVIDAKRANFNISADANLRYVDAISGASGQTDMTTLNGVERVAFNDGLSVALDTGVNQSGGHAALLLGAVLGQAALAAKKPLVGSVIALFDQGFSTSRLAALSIAGFVIFTTAMSGSALALEKGAMAPDFDLPGADANVGLAQYRGKVVYLDFWASWCGPCKLSFPWMNAMQAKYGAKGLQVVSVNVDVKRADAAKFLTANPASFVVAFDPQGRTPGLYAVKAMPSSYLIGRDGRITLLHCGYAPEDGAALEQEIRLTLERTP